MTTLAQRLVHAPAFQHFIIGVILLAGVLTGLETNASLKAQHGGLFRVLDGLVLGIFSAEILLKLAAEGRRPWHYFRDGWNVFDFAIVVVCALPLNSQFAAVLRLARILRVLRLVTHIPKLQLLVGALLKSLGAMGYVGLLLGLVFYIYGVAGVNLFGRNDPEHFGNLGRALLTLFQVITLEDWRSVFNLQFHGSGAAPQPLAATLYFVSFILLGTMIILNLFIGIVMNSMAEMHEEIAAREQAAPNPPTTNPTVDGELDEVERQLAELQQAVQRLRRPR